MLTCAWEEDRGYGGVWVRRQRVRRQSASLNTHLNSAAVWEEDRGYGGDRGYGADKGKPFMSSFKKPPSTSFEDLTPVANSDSQNHSANSSNQGSSFASIGNLQSMNSIEDSLLGFFDQHHSENRSNRGSSSASIGDLQSLNSIDNSLPESFDQFIPQESYYGPSLLKILRFEQHATGP
ncbi:hypothetical protein TEA_018063 [Camellia sinensis var. sinensis]|uniref:Uncharacterized protein n=1 Tax=Camellia sinensis var. sinensis TaxID=542762 RepID=A0A4S4DGK1_CAMSN|nr:hypothetical protein TEA_018063 [Camellia sinensis var. sinensis]